MQNALLLVDHPYVSEFLRSTIIDHQLPLVLTQAAQELGFETSSSTLDEPQAIDLAQTSEDLRIYTSSENAISWIAEHLNEIELPELVDTFKNKAKFRQATAPLYPDFFSKELELDELDLLDVSELPSPFIIKPTVGFFSVGVYKVNTPEDWSDVKHAIKNEITSARGMYPEQVLGTTSFLIEQCIEGEEFALDAFYDSDGQPVILSIWKRRFASDTDTGDRLYTSSKQIILKHLKAFTECLLEVGKLTNARNIPIHVELRQDEAGRILPIEFNPLRFGGWCTTADITHYAYQFNPYLYYFNHQQPDWDVILDGKDDVSYHLVVLDNTTGVDKSKVKSFDYDGLVKKFTNPLEVRPIDFNSYDAFGFVFIETSSNETQELEYILNSDLTNYITTQ